MTDSPQSPKSSFWERALTLAAVLIVLTVIGVPTYLIIQPPQPIAVATSTPMPPTATPEPTDTAFTTIDAIPTPESLFDGRHTLTRQEAQVQATAMAKVPKPTYRDWVRSQRRSSASTSIRFPRSFNPGDASAFIPSRSSGSTGGSFGGARSGAVCNDGTYSSATGQGACSHHGGVAHWL